MRGDFAFVDELASGIRWDAKYATWDNFTGKPVDGYLANRIVGTRALCTALERATERAENLGFGLLLWDGYRPQHAVDCLLRWSQQPEDGRTKSRHYPNIDRAEMFEKGYVAARSGHSRGSTVDLTLYDLATGELVPMGGDHDLMDSISHHGAQGITPTEARNRQHLRSLMETCGFSAYECEWWHYTLDGEPYPDTYFDFPITQDAGLATLEPCEAPGSAVEAAFASPPRAV
ncbi:D-Ala-D-Ala dipeptidase VanX [Streptomyces sp. NRRL B-1347]|uniref:D-Ala-D-Ala dipeptidase VanX n=1 Tax=Streptomyces sp. NRRL B-1347 TaxID=1476877 RepID=UPI001F1F86F7|nr:D-Ala-D-Ala dipeptidase VanX [Streptomyces sp. NRRL B-1347]